MPSDPSHTKFGEDLAYINQVTQEAVSLAKSHLEVAGTTPAVAGKRVAWELLTGFDEVAQAG